jgi:hypothetical protein
VPDPLTAPMPLKVLLATSAPSNQKPLNLAHEEAQIRASLSRLGEQYVQLEVLHHTTPDRLQQMISSYQPHVLHYIGHGLFDKQKQEGALLLEDDNGLARTFYATLLADTLRNSSVRLIILNACETSAEAEGEAFMGVASALVGAGIPAVIAMQYKVPDALALRYSEALYEYLVRAKPLDEAVTEMRIQAANGPGPDDQVWWGIATLFMRAENGVLWQSQPGVALPTSFSISKTITPPPSGESFTVTQTISGNSGIAITNSGTLNVGGSITQIGGDTGVGRTAVDESTLRQQIEQLLSQFVPHLDSLDPIEAQEFQDDMEDAAKSVPTWSRTRRKLNNALHIVENLRGIDSLLNQLEKLLRQVEKLA